MNYPYNPYNPYMYQQPAPDQLQQLRMSPTQMPGTSDERIWVQGEGAAQAYLVAPNSFVRLWDSQAPVYYEKRADHTGKPYMEVYEYKRRGAEAPNATTYDTAPYDDRIKALETRIEALEKGAAHDE